MKRGPVDVVSDIAKADPGTAGFLAEALLYEALCDEVDRVRPFLERDGARYVAKRTQGALEDIAKRYPTAQGAEKAELEELAAELTKAWTVAKADSDAPVGDKAWWEQERRDAKGRWTKGAVDALRLFTGNHPESQAVREESRRHMNTIACGDRYNRVRAIGGALANSSNPHAQAAGHLTRLAGELGPEASQVFGRGLTRLSYRYRGTERRPDEAVARQARALAQATEGNDQLRLTELNKFGVDALSRYLPQMDLAELSLKSGQLPPSRGIIFDAQGNAVTEAVGVNGDHYLPFDLKNLKRLRGGQYVRTRATGGLTDEDIYTGLLTGARQVTVVSNSGVFSVEFDPALRGGRRYSDKARAMVDRYSSLLERINQGDLIREDISPKEKAQIKRAAYERAKYNETLGEQYYKDDLHKEQLKRRFQSKDDDELQAEAEEQARAELKGQNFRGEVKGVSGRTLAQRQKDIYRQLQGEQRDQMVRHYRLDGEGYRDAQRALHQEFPFFVRRTQFIPLDEYLLNGRLAPNAALPPRVGADIGYTRRNHLGPHDSDTKPKRGEEPAAGEVKADKPKGPDSGGGGATVTSWETALADPDSAFPRELGDQLERSFNVVKDLDTDDWTQPDPDEQYRTDKAAETMGTEQWVLWAKTEKGGPAALAKWLAKDASPTNLDNAEKALKFLRSKRNNAGGENGGDVSFYDGFDEALQSLQRIKVARKPFEKAGETPVLTAPDGDKPAPQPIEEIWDLGPDLKKITDYAVRNDDVAELAQGALTPDGEKKLIESINKDVAKIQVIHKWPPGANGKADEEHKPAGGGHGVTSTDVDLWNAGSHDTPLYQDLERKQKAWALARAAQIAAWKAGAEVPDLVPKEETGKRAPLPPRLVLHRSATPRARR